MGKTRLARIAETLQNLKAVKGEMVSFEEFRKELMMKVGSDEKRSVEPTMKLIMEMNLAEDAGDGNVRIK